MNTPAIFNPASITAAPPSPGKAFAQPAPSSSETSFNSMLNREIADRRSNGNSNVQAPAPRAPEKQSAAEAPKQSDAPPSTVVQKSSSSGNAQKPENAEGTTKNDTTEVADDTGVKPGDARSVTENLLAFVNDVAEVTSASAAGDTKKKDVKDVVDNTVAEVPEGFVDPRLMMDVRSADSRPVAKPVEDANAKRGDASDKLLSAVGTSKDDRTPVDGKTSLAKGADATDAKDPNAKAKPDFAVSVNQAEARQTTRPGDATAKPVELPAASNANSNAAQVGKATDASVKLTPVELAAIKLQDTAGPANPGLIAPMPQAFTAVQAAAGKGVEALTPNVGTPGWDQALGQKVVWMVAGAQQSATLTLNPPDLGPLQIVLNVSNTDATATFTAAQPEVRQALEAAMPRLREMLGEAGIQLGQANVNAGNPNQGNAFANQSAPQSSGRFNNGNDSADTPVNVTTRVQATKGGLGMVDTFA